MTHQAERLIRGEHPLFPVKPLCDLSGVKYDTLRRRLERGGQLRESECEAVMATLEKWGVFIDWSKLEGGER